VIKVFESARLHHRAGRLREAEGLYREVLHENPQNTEAMHLLGLALAAQGKLAAAIAELRRAVAVRPEYAEAVYNLGKALQDAGQLDEAADAYRRAATLRPDYTPAFNNLGVVLQRQNQFASAEAAYRDAIRAQPGFADAHYNLGNVLKEQNRLDEAIGAYRQALLLRASYPEALTNLGNVLQRMGKLDEATAAFKESIALDPKRPHAHNSLGNALKDAGRLDGAIECYRRSIAVGGGAWAWDNLLYALHFHPNYDAGRIKAEHAEWNRRVAGPLAGNSWTFGPAAKRGGRIRVGYVSPDFRAHPVGRFLLPLLAHHDRESFEIHCYSDVRQPDEMTEQLRGHADAWRDTDGVSDERLAALVRDDEIDVLVDLTMHMEGNRLLTFARKPAPVQVTYLAYCGTTGLHAMDYRLSDPFLDPLGSDESVYVEKTVRLPRTYWCYQPPAAAGEVEALPALANGYVTFGCFNNYSKVTDAMWAVWFRILELVPRSRLIVQSPDGQTREAARERSRRGGWDPERVEFASRAPMGEYLRTYGRIDVALDPFPYGGGTTTCDALWMGVPVVSLAGKTAVSRGGLSILSNIGSTEWVAMDVEDYVKIATGLAADLARLKGIRTDLRERICASPLIDAAQFARDVEVAYVEMCRARCDS